MSFCLYFIHGLGRDGAPIYDARVLANVAIIWLTFGYYSGIAQPVIEQIRSGKKSTVSELSDESGAAKT